MIPFKYALDLENLTNYFNQSETKLSHELNDRIKLERRARIAYSVFNQTMFNYRQYIEGIFNEFSLQVAVYDEADNFYNSNYTQLNYPFENRKTEIETGIHIENMTWKTNYSWSSFDVYFKRSQTCLQPTFIDQLTYLYDIWEFIWYDVFQIYDREPTAA